MKVVINKKDGRYPKFNITIDDIPLEQYDISDSYERMKIILLAREINKAFRTKIKTTKVK